MFKDVITITKFSTNMAESYFGNIYGYAFFQDSSFISTTRALLHGRIGENETLNLSYYGEIYMGSGQIYSDLLNLGNNNLRIYDFKGTSEWTEERIPDGYVFSEKVEKFFEKMSSVKCYINEEKKSTAIFVEDFSIKKMHYLQSAIPVFLPWFFDQTKSEITDKEMELLNSFSEKSPDKYIEIITEIANEIGFEEEVMERELNDFENKNLLSSIEEKKRHITRIINAINEKQNEIMELIRNKENEDIYLLGMEEALKTRKSGEIIEFFRKNKNLHFRSVQGNRLEFSVTGYLEVYDKEIAEKFIGNEDSYLYDESRSIPPEDNKMFLEALFLNDVLKLKVCSTYTIELPAYVRARGMVSYTGYSEGIYDEFIPNPHIYIHECLGNYEHAARDFMENHDYIGAIVQLIVSNSSLNLSESVTIEPFMRALYGQRISFRSSHNPEKLNNKCIELPDGTVTTPQGAIEYLKNNKEG